MKRVWKGLSIMAGVLGAADVLAVGAFFNLAAGRRCVFLRKKKEPELKRTEGVCWMEGMNPEKAVIESRDGLKLKGYYPGGGARPRGAGIHGKGSGAGGDAAVYPGGGYL